MSIDAIGGYFSLDPGGGRGLAGLSRSLAYRSARSAMAAALAAAKPSAVWVPNFICGAVADAVRTSGIEAKRYPLSSWFGVPDDVKPDPGDWVICTDYFGLNSMAIDRAIIRFGAHRVLTDASQSLYFEARPGSTTVYSPRKFFGIPDGGLLVTPFEVAPPFASNEGESLARSAHLLYRNVGQIEKGYSRYQAAEASLASCEPVAMSDLTRVLLGSIDAESAATVRMRNYNHLAEYLPLKSMDVPLLPSGAVPLCCPVACHDAESLRSKLTSRHIFTPVYWPDAEIPDGDCIGLRLRDHTVYLPCDQRYGESEMSYIANIMIETMEAS